MAYYTSLKLTAGPLPYRDAPDAIDVFEFPQWRRTGRHGEEGRMGREPRGGLEAHR